MARTADNQHSDWMVNLSALSDYDLQYAFIDLMKSARGLVSIQTNAGPTDFDAATTAGHIDKATGWPVVPGGATHITSYNCWFHTINYPIALHDVVTGGHSYLAAGRKLEIRWTGAGTLNNINGAWAPDSGQPSIPYTATDGVIILVSTGDNNADCVLEFTSVNQTNPVRDVRILLDEHKAAYDAGEIFNPDFLELIKPYCALRTMQWTNTPSNNDTVAQHIVDYADSRKEGWMTYAPISELIDAAPPVNYKHGTSVPPAVIAKLCNKIKADCWVTLHFSVSDAFVTSFTQEIHNNLDADLKIIFEYGNEIWNTGFSLQYNYCRAQSPSFGPDFAPNQNKWNGYRSGEIMELVKAVLDGTGRVYEGGLSAQNANSATLTECFEGLDQYINNDPSATIQKSQFFGSVTTYFMPTVGGAFIEGVSNTFPAVVITREVPHPFSNGDRVTLLSSADFPNRMTQLNPTTMADAVVGTVQNASTYSFELAEVDATGWAKYGRLSPDTDWFLTVATGNVQTTNGDNTVTVICPQAHLLTAGKEVLFNTTETFGGITINAGDRFVVNSEGLTSTIFTFEHPNTPTGGNSTIAHEILGMFQVNQYAWPSSFVELGKESEQRFAAGLEPNKYEYCNRMMAKWGRGDLFLPDFPAGENIPQMEGWWQDNKTVCDNNGVAFGPPYEGGSHFVTAITGSNGVNLLTEWMNECNNSHDMAKLYSEAAARWMAAGGVFQMKYNICTPHSTFGPWGLYRSLDDTNSIEGQIVKMTQPGDVLEVKFK